MLTTDLSNEDRAWVLLKGREARQTGKPVYLETVQTPSMTAPFPKFLLWCEPCKDYTIAIPQGRYGRLSCRHCRKVHGRMLRKPGPDSADRRLVYAALFRLGLLVAAFAALILLARC